MVLRDLVPDLRVDPQGPGQGEAGPRAGDPAAQRARDGADGSFQTRQCLETRRAERVVAVQHPRHALPAGVPVAADDALELLTGQHVEFRSADRRAALMNQRSDRSLIIQSSTQVKQCEVTCQRKTYSQQES